MHSLDLILTLTGGVDELLAVRRVAIPGAIAQSAAATLLGTLLVHGLGWPLGSGIVFGIALSVTSAQRRR